MRSMSSLMVVTSQPSNATSSNNSGGAPAEWPCSLHIHLDLDVTTSRRHVPLEGRDPRVRQHELMRRCRRVCHLHRCIIRDSAEYELWWSSRRAAAKATLCCPRHPVTS